MNSTVLENNINTDELEKLLVKDGKIVPVPFAELNKFPQQVISMFCLKNGLYQVPTTELIEFIKGYIVYNGGPDGFSKSLEIGSGNGCMGRNIGITMTDNKMQEWPEIKSHYESMGQPTVRYGDDVLNIAANDAVIKFKGFADTVIASWVTHKWVEGMDEGNMYGVDESKLFTDGVKRYVHVGNDKTHSRKPVLRDNRLKVKVLQFPWLVSRSMQREHNSIYVIETK